MLAIVRGIVLSAGWPRRLIACGAGAISALAMAPLNLLPGMVIGFTVAVWLIDGAARGEQVSGWRRMLQPRSFRAAAGAGWWWGLGYFVAGLWWLGAAFLVEPDKDAWALPFGVLGVPAVLALFPALGFGLARLLWSQGAGRIFAFAAALALSEWLRGWVLTGFPWNNYGMGLGGHLVLGQLASLVGNDGLTLLALAICAAPATLADRMTRAGPARRRFLPTAIAVLALLGCAGYGAMRLPREPTDTVAGVRLRIMQPAIPQDANFSFANKDKILADYLALSDRATSPNTSGLADVTHLIWPESAFPFILSQDPEALDAIAKTLPQSTVLLTGAARAERPSAERGNEPTFYNSIEVIGPGGTVIDDYDKVHLVPFGEYLPFDRWLRGIGLTHFVHIPGGFTAGRRHRLLSVPGLPPLVPSICYEAIFSDEVLSPEDRDRAGAILNVTNDGWFGQTSGPYQHLAQARLRAVEQGLPLVRAANTGISAVFDPYGRVVARLPLGARNVLDAPLPQHLPPTFYSHNFRWIRPGLLVFALAVVAIAAMRNRFA